MFALIIMLIGIIWRSDDVRKVSLIILIITALFTIPVYLTGEKAEGIVKGMEGVSEEYIDDHEDFAEISFIAMNIAGVIAIAGLILYRKPKILPVYFIILIMIIMMIINGMMGWTAHLGGKIHHPETHEFSLPWEKSE
jgi:archaellum biogenesis protein FlaJ (TadC family)